MESIADSHNGTHILCFRTFRFTCPPFMQETGGEKEEFFRGHLIQQPAPDSGRTPPTVSFHGLPGRQARPQARSRLKSVLV